MTAPVHPLRIGRFAALGVALAATLAGSCAPHRVAVGELDVAGRRGSYLRGLAARESPAGLIEAEITLWARARGSSRIGASGTLALAPPDGMRLRLDSMFGTALDLGARAESVKAVMPARRVAVAVDAARDTLGVVAPGALAYRVLSGAWRPPDGAWWHAAGGGLEARWVEGGDSLTLTIGDEGLPQRVDWHGPRGPDWTLRYVSWTHQDGLAWPAAIRIQDGRGQLSLSTRLERLRLRRQASPERLAVRAPADTEWVGWRRFRRALEEIEAWLE